jgi:hypothetical protein
MFAIEGKDVSALNDVDLRSLVVRLCEAELTLTGLPLSAITAGGDQNAPDGGLDVRVTLEANSQQLDFIPRSICGFQVKKPDMPASEITKEMQPDGVLRQSIRTLAECQGAYIIVSAQGSAADAAYQRRLDAMQACCADLCVDFYDRERLARWVNQYPGVALWLRERIGTPLSGWQPYGTWAYRDAADSIFIDDERARVQDCRNNMSESMTMAQGITALRRTLAAPLGIARLVGLSGVGKTRLVQALFDHRVGDGNLNPALALYTDEGAEPRPTPQEMIARLGVASKRAIIVVDNCKPDTHRILVEALQKRARQVSLITIEYDISEDEPDSTEVYRLASASSHTTEAILEQLVPVLSYPDRSRIAEFSGGNARIALSLARNARGDHNLARLTDEELFRRLFWQRNERGDALMRAAEACALVYSFDVETIEGDASELRILAGFANTDVQSLYRDVAELKVRDLAQARTRWRAILPHAIANRLAKSAIDRAHVGTLLNLFQQSGQIRLLKSFSRRLGYLHDCQKAKEIAEKWLENQGLLHNVAQLNADGNAIFTNIAPLAPQAALAAIEATAFGDNSEYFLSIDNNGRGHWMHILRSLAFDPTLFDRAARILALFYSVEPARHNYNSAKTYFIELFHLYLSGTHATVEMRLQVVKYLINHPSDALQRAGFEALNAMFQVGGFISSHDFSFGGRHRDHGWQPTSVDQLNHWFRVVLGYLADVISNSGAHTERLKALIAERIGGLWKFAHINDELEAFIAKIATESESGWPEAWLAIRSILAADCEQWSPTELATLNRLNALLKPTSVLQRIRAYVLNHQYWSMHDIHGLETIGSEKPTFEETTEHIKCIVTQIGQDIIRDSGQLDAVLPELLGYRSSGYLYEFGRGMGLSAIEPIATWRQFTSALAVLSTEQKNTLMLCGYLNGLASRNAEIVEDILEEAVLHPILGPYFPELQCAVNIGDAGGKRLIDALNAKLAPAYNFISLKFGQVSRQIPLELFAQIVEKIAGLNDGYHVAVEVLQMHIHSETTPGDTLNSHITILGQFLLAKCSFNDQNANIKHYINWIAKKCLIGDEAQAASLIICRNLARALTDYRTSAQSYGTLAETLFALQPLTALHVFYGGGRKRKWKSVRNILNLGRIPDSLLDSCDPKLLVAWGEKAPTIRFPRLARDISLFNKRNDENGPLTWSLTALEILEKSPDRSAILTAFEMQFFPSAWSGSKAEALTPYLEPAAILMSHPDPVIAEWSARIRAETENQIKNESRYERNRDESFE